MYESGECITSILIDVTESCHGLGILLKAPDTVIFKQTKIITIFYALCGNIKKIVFMLKNDK